VQVLELALNWYLEDDQILATASVSGKTASKMTFDPVLVLANVVSAKFPLRP